MKEIFGPGTNSIDDVGVDNIVLPRHAGKELTAKKLKSLSKKYFSTPPEKLNYYPNVSEDIMDAPSSDDEKNGDSTPRQETTTRSTRSKKKKKKVPVAVGVNAPKMPARLGRQKKKLSELPGQRSILSFFAKK